MDIYKELQVEGYMVYFGHKVTKTENINLILLTGAPHNGTTKDQLGTLLSEQLNMV